MSFFTPNVSPLIPSNDFKKSNTEAHNRFLLKKEFQKNFGNIDENYKPDNKIISTFLKFANMQPNEKKNYNPYDIPKNFLEYSKWIRNIENDLDTEVREDYVNMIHLLKNTQPLSILQLKNKLMGYWHSDRQYKDYIEVKLIIVSAITNKLVCSRPKFFSTFYFNPSIDNIENSLYTRSLETFARIGHFQVNNKDYEVIASHLLADENTPHMYANPKTQPKKLRSASEGNTTICFIEKGNSNIRELLKNDLIHKFNVCIGRETKRNSNDIHSEQYLENPEVVNNRHLVVCNHRGFKDSTKNTEGSDRLLDQKLIQIMIEVAHQNSIISIKIDSNHDDLPLLTAAGFDSHHKLKILNELKEFRSNPNNRLFPPYENYRSVLTNFKMKNIKNEIFLFSKEATNWSEVIEKTPILNPQAAILPEYWVTQPNLV